MTRDLGGSSSIQEWNSDIAAYCVINATIHVDLSLDVGLTLVEPRRPETL
jgi:hypothetical protein